jgi:neutral ceramidase
MLLAGTSIIDISPGKGVELAGYPHHPRHNTGVHDPLYASCLYLNNGTVELELICLDLVMLHRKAVRAIRSAIQEATGIPGEHILISCSHTHSGPWASSRLDAEALANPAVVENDYTAALQEKIIGIGIDACKHPFAAQLGVEKTYCGREQGVGGNRIDPMDIADAEVWVIGVRDHEDTLRCCFAKYALHPTFIHSDSTEVSADYPGYIRAYLAQHYPGMVFLFAQGTSGNQSPRYFRSGKTFAEAERVGSTLGKAIKELLERMDYSEEVELGAVSEDIDLEVRQLLPLDVAERDVEEKRRAWEVEQQKSDNDFATWLAELHFLGAEHTLAYVQSKARGEHFELMDEIPCEVQVISLGDARLVALPGEIFVEFGKTIQYRSGFVKCFVVELANGCLPGYVCTAQAYARGGYEAGTSMLTENSGDQLVECAVGMLKKTRRL